MNFYLLGFKQRKRGDKYWKEVDEMQIGIWIGMVVSLIIAFIVGNLYGQPLHWYLFVLMLVIGVFINVVILILKTKDENV